MNEMFASCAGGDSPLVDGLNPEQSAAVSLPAEHALILAGAGSGKTRVLTTRIAWLIQSGQVSPGGLMAVTFTNKAAKEMTVRLQSMLPLNVRGMWIGTFHGLCNRLLRAHHALVGLPATFQILDTADQLSAIKRLCKAHQFDDERYPPKQLQWFISGCKEDGLRPADVDVPDAETGRKVEVYRLYEEQCTREGVVDFGELMLRSYELLRDHEPVRLHYQQRFRHILVDEFQDTNKLQYLWLKQLAGVHSAVFAVGDDDQSIYAFRGARVGNMADFVREFNVQHQIKLEQNYRSVSNILDTANALIAHNRHRLGKDLRTDAGAGEPVRIMQAASDYAEADWMIEELKNLQREGTARREMAVLYRSNAQSRVIETALFNAAMPYKVYGGLRFFERAEVKHALAYLRLLENPRDDTSFLRVVNFPPRGIGARSVEQLQDAARAHNCALVDAVDAIPGKAGVNLRAFVAMIDVLREDTQNLSLRLIIEKALEVSSLLEHYQKEREGQDRLENLEELVNAGEAFVVQEGFGRDVVGMPTDEFGVSASELAPDLDTGEVLSPLGAFLTHASLEAGDNQAQVGDDAVQLMTVHAAKGLEFDVVFITGLEEGLFPHENAMSDFDGLEEERRLMYVAVTRARKRLHLSLAQTRMLHGQTRYNVPSRFLDELPEHTTKWLTPPKAAFASGLGAPSWQRSAAAAQPAWSPQWHGQKSEPTDYAGTVPVTREQQSSGIKPGAKVFHTKFGEGLVKAVEGAGADARAQVNFKRHGVKWLALGVAKLELVD
jgi:DNA helicase II / ATP-dependent DNA helicase PcrA